MTGLVIANWKMHGSTASVMDFIDQWNRLPALADVCTVVCPPHPYLATIGDRMAGMALGGQNCAEQADGAFTGEVSAGMLVDLGCCYAIVGHSERRSLYGESDAVVAAKAASAAAAGMTAVVCVGESLDEREREEHEAVVCGQLSSSLALAEAKDVVVAYEPVWAIGTGHTATPAQADSMHAVIRNQLLQQFGDSGKSIPIIYGGSVKPGNAAELFQCDHIDGALVGGASLDANSFWQIASVAGTGRT